MAQTDFFKIGQAAYGGGADVSKAIGEGLKELRQSFTTYLYEWQKKERAWKESIAPKLAKIGEDYSPSLVDESQRSAMTAALQESRLKYADILKQARNMDPTSEEYISLMGQATDIVAGFDTTFKSAQEFSRLGNEYALAAQKADGLSRGMTVEKRAALGKIFIEKDYTFERDPVTGEMSYTINSNAVGKDGKPVNIKGLKISQDELDDFRMPNQDSVNKYLAQNKAFSDAGQQGKKITTESVDYLNASIGLKTELNNLNIEDLRSLALDYFISEENGTKLPIAILDNINLENIYDLTKEELAGKLHDKMMTTLLDTNQRDYKAPTPKGKEASSYEQALSLYNQFKQNPIGYFETFTGVAPSWDRKTNIVKVYEGGELQFEYNLNNSAERGRFYKQLLDQSQYLKGTSAKEEEIRRIFDILAMSGSPQLSSNTVTEANANSAERPAPSTIVDEADKIFNAESFSTKPLSIPANLTRNEKFFINELSKTKADITEQDIAEAVYKSPGKQIITIFGKEYKPKALYEKDAKSQSKGQDDFKNLLEASNERVPISIRNKYKDNEYLDQLNITDISQLTYKDIEKINLLEKNISLSSIDSALAQAKFDSKKIS